MMNTEMNYTDRHLHEECGVFGIYSQETADVASLAYYALYSLQHRGQESAGIVVNDDGVFTSYRDVGLVSEVFSQGRLKELGGGNIAVGHVRYGTTGSDNKRNVQPILVNHYKGHMALAHNGNLTNSAELREDWRAAAPSSRPRRTPRSSPISSSRNGSTPRPSRTAVVRNSPPTASIPF